VKDPPTAKWSDNAIAVHGLQPLHAEKQYAFTLEEVRQQFAIFIEEKLNNGNTK
jgi:hypothetical protein